MLAGAAAAGETGDAVGDGPALRWAWTALRRPGPMLLAVGEPRAVVELLDAAATAAGDVRRRSGERISDAAAATRLDCGNTADMSTSRASKCRPMAGTATSRARS